ncbi:MAG: hypothetical protein K9J37_07835 [Saprospiraceae bacterium]|nr:hypothetical protein [Saprospiraceae bacterium]MCF8249808.1 hypothetical protein [Saprospiraceae bacterium]MCF8279293.1 hypothetical protein [Bacteroidales bacterium]MCF8313441.1 hypothetical protein [Saprospiraceae bacterium]MCF8442154.1 hypothetical protein [Saprospiraceae bacterium]
MAMLEVIVGMIFTFMLLSLLGTTFNELVSSWRGWRGFYLEEALKRLLEYKDNPEVFNKFMGNPMFKQLMQHRAPLRVSQAPAFLSSSNFASILSNVLKKKNEALESVDDYLGGLPEDSQLRAVLEQFKEEGHTSVDAYKARMQSWFDDVMWQSSGWYKRHLQFVTFFVGLGIAIVLNANSFQIYSHLSTNAESRQEMAALAKTFVNENETLPTFVAPHDSLSVGEIKEEMKKAVNAPEIRTVSNILGLGWERSDIMVGIKPWVTRILGWFITALAISLGAPFWFDILKKIVTIQSTGSAPSGGTGSAQVVINTGSGEVKK